MFKFDKIVYQARTQREYDWLMIKMGKNRYHWKGSDDDPFNLNLWSHYESDTCVVLENKELMLRKYSRLINNQKYADYRFVEVSDLIEEQEYHDMWNERLGYKKS